MAATSRVFSTAVDIQHKCLKLCMQTVPLCGDGIKQCLEDSSFSKFFSSTERCLLQGLVATIIVSLLTVESQCHSKSLFELFLKHNQVFEM